jgi:type I restriction enzyme M protein
MVDRTHRELADSDIADIAGAYHAWRGDPGAESYRDVPGSYRSATFDEIARLGFVLTPGRYVGAAALEDDGESFDSKMRRLTATLHEQQAQAGVLDTAIAESLRVLGYE